MNLIGKTPQPSTTGQVGGVDHDADVVKDGKPETLQTGLAPGKADRTQIDGVPDDAFVKALINQSETRIEGLDASVSKLTISPRE